MAAPFCSKCGQPLPEGAQFCLSCGTPVAPSAPPLSSATAPPAAPVPPLGVQLGLGATRSFLLQHLLIGPKHSYRVLDAAKRPLLALGEDYGAERSAWSQQVRTAWESRPAGVTWGRSPFEATSFWIIEDPSRTPRGSVVLRHSGRRGECVVSGPGGAPEFVVRIEPSGLAGLAATALAPDGRPILESKGNLFHHEFGLHDASGAEVVKVHEAWVSARDTFSVDLTGPVDPMAAIVLAVLIDHFKGK